jgi:hypothetical protein
MTSSRYRNCQPARLQDENGEHFGWELPDGSFACGSLLTPSTAKQTEIDAAEAAMLVQKTALDARNARLDQIRAKREAGTALDDADVETLADVVLGRPVS